MPEMGYRPVSQYLPPRWMRPAEVSGGRPEREAVGGNGFLGWIDRLLSR
jgi:hypothetical protein